MELAGYTAKVVGIMINRITNNIILGLPDLERDELKHMIAEYSHIKLAATPLAMTLASAKHTVASKFMIDNNELIVEIPGSRLAFKVLFRKNTHK